MFEKEQKKIKREFKEKRDNVGRLSTPKEKKKT